MRYLSQKRKRFTDTLSNYSTLYNYTNQKEQLVVSAGTLNFIWNHWNNFWRDYWIAHVSGGYYLDNSPITPIKNNYSDKQSLHYILHITGYKRSHTIGDMIIGSHQEKTWGDPDIIVKVASAMNGDHPHMTYLLGLLGTYQTFLQHFQRIRNSFIHLSNENIYQLTTISGYYSFSPTHGLLDILETRELASSTKCFDNLLANMNGMLMHL